MAVSLKYHYINVEESETWIEIVIVTFKILKHYLKDYHRPTLIDEWILQEYEVMNQLR